MSLTTVFRRASSRVATLAFRAVRSPVSVRGGSERLILGSRASVISFSRFHSTESAVTKTSADENLVSVLESEIDCAVQEEAPHQNVVSSLFDSLSDKDVFCYDFAGIRDVPFILVRSRYFHESSDYNFL